MLTTIWLAFFSCLYKGAIETILLTKQTFLTEHKQDPFSHSQQLGASQLVCNTHHKKVTASHTRTHTHTHGAYIVDLIQRQ